jgi:hypothetical protein
MRVLSRALMAIVIPLAVVGAILTVLRDLTALQPAEPTRRTAVEVAAAIPLRTATPSQTATRLPTLTPSATPTPPPTPMPSATATPQPTLMPAIEPTATRRPTETAEPTPTSLPTPTEIPATPHLATYGEVASYRLNLRRGPGAGYEMRQTLIQGDRLEVIAKATDGIWLQVIAPDGTEGWVNSSYVDVPQAVIEGLPVAGPPPSG